ncbi:hypothetical protein [Pseudohongiella spirulinae]|uniref:Peptidase metallopeptidase domain-containing protein n=1 Tax=Pseudohongiella spirulinae TaxID=1249552 RepID=A0A0S2KET2_9GAMM|nr:hypothetical protein [Pseudohongiella spirulinae]ALO46611.1 hypothetical protein PS2015_1969 [Pseudohongiella spirulinae]
MSPYIAGKDNEQYDATDWGIPTIPVYLNPKNLPPTTTVEQAEQMIKDACFSWSLRYSHDLRYAGLFYNTVSRDAIVINYNSSAQLLSWYGKEVNGLCRYHPDGYIGDKRRLVSAEIYINSDNRPLPNRFARATIKHELGHACGIHGHNDQPGSVMYTSSMGNEKLTLHDCQMLDEWNPYPVELHRDYSMSCPAVDMQDGRVLWVECKHRGNMLVHSWELASDIQWDGPRLDNVQLGDGKLFHGQPAHVVKMRQVRHPDMTVRAEMALVKNGLILEYAE